MGHVVTAGYVTVETAVSGGRAAIDIPRGTVLPDDVPPEQVARLKQLGHVAEAAAEQPAAVPVEGPAPVPEVGPADGTVGDVMSRVAGDPVKARAALDAELAKGDKARSTLVAALTAIITPAEPPAE